MRYLFFLSTLLISLTCFGQTKFKIDAVRTKNWKSIYYIVNEKGKTIKELDTAKYVVSMNGGKYGYFAILLIKGEKGWSAIDSNERILFKVYNSSFGEPSPDEIIDNKIRIVDENDKIGFADFKGKIIIEPKFEVASSFYKGKAIIGKSCVEKPWTSAEDENHSGCHHYSIECEKFGYINSVGKILEIGDYKFEEIKQKIKWKARE